MDSYRTLWVWSSFKQVTKEHKFDRNHVTQFMRANDSPEAALEHIKSYFEAQSRVYWANSLRIVGTKRSNFTRVNWKRPDLGI